MNQQKNKICVIGATNIDITGFSKKKLIQKDSNIGTSKISLGGVGRNIAENLHNLDLNVNFLSVFTDDFFAEFMKKSFLKSKLNINESFFIKDASSSTFIAILNNKNDLETGISSMEIYDRITKEMIQKKMNFISEHNIVVLDTNYPQKILEYICNNLNNQKIIIDTVSGTKALKIKNILDKLYVLKTNLSEAQTLTGIKILNEKDLQKTVSYFLSKGIKNVFITLGKKGVIFGNERIIKKYTPNITKIKNTIGAGDAFAAGIIYGIVAGYDIEKTAKYGIASSSINLKDISAVSKKMNVKNLIIEYKNLNYI